MPKTIGSWTYIIDEAHKLLNAMDPEVYYQYIFDRLVEGHNISSAERKFTRDLCFRILESDAYLIEHPGAALALWYCPTVIIGQDGFDFIPGHLEWHIDGQPQRFGADWEIRRNAINYDAMLMDNALIEKHHWELQRVLMGEHHRVYRNPDFNVPPPIVIGNGWVGEQQPQPAWLANNVQPA